MKTRRIAAILGLVAALTPGTWLRSAIPLENLSAPTTIQALPVGPASFGPFRFEKAWSLESESRVFGGFSALAPLDAQTLLAGSDAGAILHITHDRSRPIGGRLGYLPGRDSTTKRDVDLEALSVDQAIGTLWAAFERTNRIEKRAPDLMLIGSAQPDAMTGWNRNSGPESLVALADGRLIAIAEASRGGLHDVAILPREDPSNGPAATARLKSIKGFRPVDAAQVSPQEVVVLFRDAQFGLPSRFVSALAVYEIGELRENGVWRPTTVALFPAAIPQDNYEGLAVLESSAEEARLWLISDDNFSAFQRTLMLEIVYRPDADRRREKARRKPARLSNSSE